MTESPDAFAVFLDAVQSGRWMLAAAALLVGLVWITRTFGGHALPWLASDRGGAALALAGGVAGAVLTALLAGEDPSLALLARGTEVGIMAAGGWTVVKKLIAPSDRYP